MTVRRGLFRIWMVLSTTWAIASGLLFMEGIQSPFLSPVAYLYREPSNDFVIIPDYGMRYELQKTHTEVTFPNNVSWFVPNTVPNAKMKALVPDFLKAYVEPRQAEVYAKRVSKIQTAAMVAILPSAAILFLGAALIWAFSGFRPTPVEPR